MKSVLFSMVVFFAGVASAQIKSEVLTYHNVSNCNGWFYSMQANGYVCTSYPYTAQVADVHSVLDNLKALDARIKALEAKVQLLEAKAQQ